MSDINTIGQITSLASTAKGLVIPFATDQLYALARKTFGYENIKVYNPIEAKAKGTLGLPVFMPLTLGEEGDSLSKWYYMQNGKKQSVDILEIACCIIEISGTKEIVKSMPSGGSVVGSVKEYINQGDYIVNIKGILATKDGTYPKTDVDTLHLYIKATSEIPVYHKLLDQLGIYSLVIESWAFPARPGFENLQAFELNCVSDYPFEMDLRNKADLTSV